MIRTVALLIPHGFSTSFPDFGLSCKSGWKEHRICKACQLSDAYHRLEKKTISLRVARPNNSVCIYMYIPRYLSVPIIYSIMQNKGVFNMLILLIFNVLIVTRQSDFPWLSHTVALSPHFIVWSRGERVEKKRNGQAQKLLHCLRETEMVWPHGDYQRLSIQKRELNSQHLSLLSTLSVKHHKLLRPTVWLNLSLPFWALRKTQQTYQGQTVQGWDEVWREVMDCGTKYTAMICDAGRCLFMVFLLRAKRSDVRSNLSAILLSSDASFIAGG